MAGNYKSFEEAADLAEAEMKNEYERGYAQWSESKQELEDQSGALVLSLLRAS